MNFKLWIENNERVTPGLYTNINQSSYNKTTAFIYFSDDTIMQGVGKTHGQVMGNIDLEQLRKAVMFGRILISPNDNTRTVTFWGPKEYLNTNPNYLLPCLRKMLKTGMVDEHDKVSTWAENGTVGGMIGGVGNNTSNNADLYKQLHTMKPDEKRWAMQQLGVGGNSKPHPWNAASIIPGQKWWAINSENGTCCDCFGDMGLLS
jgi:hypothetical protein